MAKIIKLPSIPNVSFMSWNTYEECRMYNQKLTRAEYNKAFGIKDVKKEVKKSYKKEIKDKSFKDKIYDK